MKLHLFEGYGIEAEYMIVDKNTLKIKPIAEEILKFYNKNQITNEVALNSIAISNEIVSHVIELKTNGPKKILLGLDKYFHQIILNINDFLNIYNAILMPTAMHPFMNPDLETYLWQYGNREIYYTYNKIFNCKGHGWSNLQSIHINLPFYDEKEFVQLHNAIRIVLPLIPALSASSPFVEKKLHYLDTRLMYYENNQKKIPSITGKVIPEWIESIDDYYNKILYPMYNDIKPYDPQEILQEEWLNSRGAISRFERNAIEIRVMDIQESPVMDITLICLWVKLIQYLISNNKIIPIDLELLYNIYKKAIEKGTVTNLPEEYLNIWSIKKKNITIKEFIKLLLNGIDYPDNYLPYLKIILKYGNLSERILNNYNNSLEDEQIESIYRNLIECLVKNQYYL
ncbi:MAG: glutamate--cysteine ligase [Leptospiraceae bacterium]|nr:MAG: glutamate--cysteine ligase [Leptospiraceae bacterium]